MTLPKDLQAKIDAFLKTRKASDGGFASVDPQEVTDLYGIVRGLIELKYEVDPELDLPVEVILTDRTRYERPAHIPVAYAHDAQRNPDLDGLRRVADTHAVLAQHHTERTKRALTMLSELLDGRVREQRPIVIGGAEYRASPKPRDGVVLSEAWLVDDAIKVFQKAYKKEPCPVDWDKRMKWARDVAASLKERWGVYVDASSCRHIATGLGVTLDVPVIGVLSFNV